MSKRKKPVIAILYDFDGTLSPGNMQEYDFIPELGVPAKSFWNEAVELAKSQKADAILSYMKLMLDKAKAKSLKIDRKQFSEYGSKLNLFDGVEQWFPKINSYAAQNGLLIQHFIVSSGLREMIEGTVIAPYFKKIYASGFMYDQHDVAVWPALAINYTTKTQYVFRINKDSLDESDNSVINKYVAEENRVIPFSNMIFIGDGETDIPCMRLVKDKGGHSIAVYTPNKKGAKEKAKQLVNEKRAHAALKADYRENGDIFKIVCSIMDKVKASEDIKRAS
ncbi:HAD family hydrolase [Methylovulum psychrotolerans]|uniref:Phosphoserine phosphatase n=1 Tax=Methylovulum psychrotolerans TaxID=1704499 RepID=A0A1Z4C3Y5_9GAMM|nr:HAD family hydrolase [Methylovulum psychrotolerans]ASF48261.1 phosphoserine phosphatase [Methylovulum psychrotolerans]